MGICDFSAYVEFVSVKKRFTVKFPVSARPAGNDRIDSKFSNIMIANMLTHIRNAQAVSKKSVKVPHSEFEYELARMLGSLGFVGAVAKKGKGGKRFLEIDLKYGTDGRGAINDIQLVSKPGRRVYTKSGKLRQYKSGHGAYILSTSKGIKTDKEARQLHLGGEVVCRVW